MLIMSAGLLGCREAAPPSVVIIVTEKLNTMDLNCNATDEDQDLGGGFAVLCREFIRFTHAYTPSTQSVPALASLLTGTFPIEHKLRNNSQFLTHIKLFSEAAVEKGRRTALFSGGAPVLRKTGLHRGFEIFDDHFGTDENLLFKPFRVSIEHFKNWLKKEVQDEPFVVVFYVPDLLFKDRVTQDQFGELRNRTFESQMDELNDGLGELFDFLKSEKRWDATQIYFTSLSGRNIYGRSDEALNLNLHSELTQIPLFVKNAQKKRDAPTIWKVDQNVSLVDVGYTLQKELTGLNEPLDPALANPKLERVSLQPSFERPVPLTEDSRAIPIESGWGQPWGLWGVRTGFIYQYDLLLWNRQPILFKTLSDRLELNAQKANFGDLPEDLRNVVSTVSAEPWTPLRASKDFLELQMALATSNDKIVEEKISTIKSSDAPNLVSKTWGIDYLLYRAFEKKDWKRLRDYAQTYDRPVEKAYAEALMNKNTEALMNQPCYRVFRHKGTKSGQASECRDRFTVELLKWMQKKDMASPFLVQIRNLIKERTFILRNLALEQEWDVPMTLRLAPQEAELLLALPENAEFSKELQPLLTKAQPKENLEVY